MASTVRTGDGAIASGEGEVSDYTMTFSGNSTVPTFSHTYADLNGLIWVVGSQIGTYFPQDGIGSQAVAPAPSAATVATVVRAGRSPATAVRAAKEGSVPRPTMDSRRSAVRAETAVPRSPVSAALAALAATAVVRRLNAAKAMPSAAVVAAAAMVRARAVTVASAVVLRLKATSRVPRAALVATADSQ